MVIGSAPRDEPVDVVIIGAGLAGAMTAIELARRGVPTMLVGAAPSPGIDSYDVLLAADTTRAIVGFTDAVLPSRTIRSLVTSFGGGRNGRFDDLELVVCRQDDLRDALLNAARRHGARHLAGEVTEVHGRGSAWQVTIRVGGNAQSIVRARHLVMAAGAAGAGTFGVPDAGGLGMTCLRQFEGHSADEARLFVVPPDAVPQGSPASIRVLPSSRSEARVTVGVTTLHVRAPADPGRIVDAAWTVLRREDPRYASLRPVGSAHGGAVGVSFTPDACVRDGMLLVGDAAGLVNPFTGEGIGGAALSAGLAADAITEHLDSPVEAGRRYVRALATGMIGHFGTTRQAARRYHLTTQVLADTAASTNPFFAKGRKAILVPGGFPELGNRQRVRLDGTAAVAAMPFMLATTEIAVTSVRKEWPFVASLMSVEHRKSHEHLRPALLFAAAAMAAGRPPDSRWAGVAAAIELSMLGTLALTATAPTVTPARRGVDWPAATAVLAGDYLLSHAAVLVTRHEPMLCGPFSDWMTELVGLRAERVAAPTGLSARSIDFFASLFEFPARVGAQLAGCDELVVSRLRLLGRYIGQIFLHAEDLLALRRETTRLDTTLDELARTRLSALPQVLARGDDFVRHVRADPQACLEAIRASRQACLDAHRKAIELADCIPASGSRHVLTAFANSLAGPALEEGKS